MKKLYFISMLLGSFFLASSCEKDEIDDNDNMNNMTEYDYHAHIMSPNTDDKHMGDTLHIHVEFESHAGETVHHINVSVYDLATNNTIYSMPTDAHVHDDSGVYEFHDEVVISSANGFAMHGNYKLEAKVWGVEDGEGEASEAVEFHVHM